MVIFTYQTAENTKACEVYLQKAYREFGEQ